MRSLPERATRGALQLASVLGRAERMGASPGVDLASLRGRGVARELVSEGRVELGPGDTDAVDYRGGLHPVLRLPTTHQFQWEELHLGGEAQASMRSCLDIHMQDIHGVWICRPAMLDSEATK